MLNSKVALVTGAASGIGLAISQTLANEGAKVLMVDVNEALLKEQAEKINASFVVADLSKREGCKEAVDFADTLGGVDILVNVAGIQTVSPIEEFPEDKWDFMINLMLTAPFLLTRYSWYKYEEERLGTNYQLKFNSWVSCF
ncbi:SDR family NAD(P)-dependent oxidoreductase [Actinobacillus equuli subsp. haemolyticus]|nr:SDR family NAD(P)-dependent oxidoreductase [Actinobacillus equuli subsp. haemolyticus]